jgi:menaquinone-9 beta-reductase
VTTPRAPLGITAPAMPWVDVLVVGAGLAGSVAAAQLARLGARVLMAGDDLEGGGAGHDVAVSAAAVRALSELGTPPAALRPVRRVDLEFGPGTRRSFVDAGAAVADRGRLERQLRRAATAAGADAMSGRVASFEPVDGGHRARIRHDDGLAVVRARHVILAVGAAATDLVPRPAGHAAGTARVQRFGGVAWDSRILLRLAPPSATHLRGRPRCLWVLPGAAGGCTVGAYAIGAGPPDDLAAALATLDPALAAARPTGPAATAPVHSGFDPARAVHAGALLVGDAAGLANPFTGEGIGHAVQSGLLAARAVAAHLDDPAAAGREYRRRLAAAFVGYFETARHAARRYHLAWRVLAATAHSDHPFFALGRRTVLLPGGVSGLLSAARSPRRDELLLSPYLAGCDEVATGAVRREWPFLAQLVSAGSGRSPWLRPATILFAAFTAAGTPPHQLSARVGAATDLAALGALAFLGPVPPPRTGRGVDWESAVVVLAADFLLAQAARLVATAAPAASWAFADWLAELANRRAARLGTEHPPDAADLFGALFEFPARIGAQLGGAPPAVVQAARDCGFHCGRAFAFAEDALALRGVRTRLDTTTAALIAARTSTIPDLLGRNDLTAAELAADPGLRAAALVAASAAATDELRLARKATAAVPAGASARILRAVVAAVAPPHVPLEGDTRAHHNDE